MIPSQHQPPAIEPHLEINWRRRIFRLYPNNARLHFRRRTEIILPYLLYGGNVRETADYSEGTCVSR